VIDTAQNRPPHMVPFMCVRYRPTMFCHVSQAELSVDFHGEMASDTKLHMSADRVNQFLQREVIAIAVNLMRS
jgi:hypothetical protein